MIGKNRRRFNVQCAGHFDILRITCTEYYTAVGLGCSLFAPTDVAFVFGVSIVVVVLFYILRTQMHSSSAVYMSLCTAIPRVPTACSIVYTSICFRTRSCFLSFAVDAGAPCLCLWHREDSGYCSIGYARAAVPILRSSVFWRSTE